MIATATPTSTTPTSIPTATHTATHPSTATPTPASTKSTTLSDLLHHELRTLYGFEKHSQPTLAKMAKTAASPEVQREIQAAADETVNHVKRLEDIFALINVQPAEYGCSGIHGLLDNCSAAADIEADDAVRDAAMIAATQTVQHNEIVRYGIAHAWAKTLKLERVTQLLQWSLDEEKDTNNRLTKLAGVSDPAAARCCKG